MKRQFSLILLTLLTINCIYSQEIFEKGKIILKNKDTLHVFVGLATTYYGKVPYKVDRNSEVLSKKIKEIKTLITPYNVYENVTVKKSEELFRLVISGKLSLLEYVEINQGPTTSSSGGSMTMYSAPTIIYALKPKNDTIFIIKKKKEKVQIIQLFEDCPDLKLRIEDKAFKLEDLEDVVKRYNICKD